MVAKRQPSTLLLTCVCVLVVAAARPARATSSTSEGSGAAAADAHEWPRLGRSVLASAAASSSWWKPRLGYKFQYTLKFAFNINTMIRPDVQVYLIDGFEISAEDVAAMKAKGLFPICYFSAGSYEDWRPDKGDFLKSDYKNALDGWPGEYWLDVRSDNVKKVMTKRMEMCKAKGFLGVDPDNVDAHTQKTGFPISYADQLAYNKWLAATAHGLGLAAGLKNDPGQMKDLVGDFDYFVNEQCMQYEECDLYAPAKAALKPVWVVEYKSAAFAAACPKQLDYGIRTLYKADPDLSDDWEECKGVNYPDPDPAGGDPPPPPPPQPPPANGSSNGTWWRPAAAEKLLFNYQPKEAFDASQHVIAGTKIYVLDAATDAAAVAALAAAGLAPLCHFSAGTVLHGSRTEVAGKLAASDYGRKAKGKYYYLDITSPSVIEHVKGIMEGCKSKGFLGVAPADMDTYGKNHGFSFEAPEQLAFNTWLAKTAHGLGLAAGLTNDGDQVAALQGEFDFFVNEKCAQSQNCDVYKPVASAGKPVFQIEYSSSAFKRACKCQQQFGITSIRKKSSQTSWRQLCSDLPARAAQGDCAM